MTVPQWFLLLAATCISVRALFGIAALTDNLKFGAGRGSDTEGMGARKSHPTFQACGRPAAHQGGPATTCPGPPVYDWAREEAV